MDHTDTRTHTLALHSTNTRPKPVARPRLTHAYAHARAQPLRKVVEERSQIYLYSIIYPDAILLGRVTMTTVDDNDVADDDGNGISTGPPGMDAAAMRPFGWVGRLLLLFPQYHRFYCYIC